MFLMFKKRLEQVEERYKAKRGWGLNMFYYQDNDTYYRLY